MAFGSVVSTVVGGIVGGAKAVGKGAVAAGKGIGRVLTAGEPGGISSGGRRGRIGGGRVGRGSIAGTNGRGSASTGTARRGFQRWDPQSTERRLISQGRGRLPLSSHVVFQEGRAGKVIMIPRNDPRSLALGNPQIDPLLIPQQNPGGIRRKPGIGIR